MKIAVTENPSAPSVKIPTSADDALDGYNPAQTDDLVSTVGANVSTIAGVGGHAWSSSVTSSTPISDRTSTPDEPPATSGSGSGLVITATINGSGAPAGFATAVADAVQYFERTFTNSETLNITFDWGATGGLAESNTFIGQYSYASVIAALAAKDGGIAADAGLVLPSTDPFPAGTAANYALATPANTLWLTDAEATSLGLSTVNSGSNTNQDGTITLNSAYAYDFTSNSAVSGEFDAAALLEHEISEVMGRQLGGNNSAGNGLLPEPLALFRYTSPGVVDTSDNYSGAYFSINGGVTDLRADMGEQNGDLADWGDSTDDVVGYAQEGVAQEFTPIDVRVMEALGWVSGDTWNGATAAWTTAADWSAGVPTAASNVVIPSGNPEVTASITINSLNNSGELVFDSSGASTITGAVSNTDLIVLEGSASTPTTLTVGGGITNGHDLDVGGDCTLITQAAVTGVGVIDVATGGAFEIDAPSATIDDSSQTIQEAGSVVVAAGTATLGAGDTYSGGTTVDSGAILSIAAAADIGTGPLTLDGGSTFDMTDAEVVNNNIAIAGAASIDVAGFFDSLNGVLGGAGTLSVNGGGGVDLAGQNTYSGGTIENGGDIVLLNAGALGTGSLAMVDGADLALQVGGAYAIANAISIAGVSDIFDKAGDTATIGGIISDGTTHGALTLNNAGLLIFAGDNTYTGGTTIESGSTLSISADDNLGAGGLTLDGGSTLDLSTAFSNTFAVTLAGAATIDDNGLFFDNFNGVLSGSGALTVTGGGGFGIAGANTPSFTGDTIFAGGVLGLYNDDGLGTGTLTLDDNAGFDLPDNETVANNVEISGDSDFDVSTGNTATESGVIADVSPIATGAVTVTGGGTLVLSGDNTYTGGTTIEAGARLNLAGSGEIGAGELLIDAAGVLDIEAGDALNLQGTSNVMGTLEGAGILDQIGGSATFELGALVKIANWTLSPTATATIAENLAYAGSFATDMTSTLEIEVGDTLTMHGTTSLSGSVGGAGTLALTGGNTTLYAGAALSVTNLTVRGSATTLSVAAPATYAGTLTEVAGSTIAVATGGSFTTTGAVTFESTVSGSGSLLNSGGAATFSGNVSNSVAAWTIAGATTIVRIVPANLDYAGAFTLETGAAIGILAGGDLWLSGMSTLGGGAIEGVGTFALDGGTTTISGGDVVKVANWTVEGGATTIEQSLAYFGVFTADEIATLTLSGAGAALRLDGRSAISNDVTIDGAGALATSGASGSVSLANLTIGGTVTWNNTETVTQNGGGLTLGDASNGATRLNNAATGVYDITDDSGIALGGTGASMIVNAGTVEKTAGAAVSMIAANIVNGNTISATQGTLDLEGSLGGTGTDQVGDGATLQFDGSVYGGQTVKYAAGGGEVSLDDLDAAGVQLFHGSISGWGTGDSLDVGTAFGSGTMFNFIENSGNTGGVLHLANGTLHAAIAFAGDFSNANFTPNVDASGATVFAFHA